MKKPTRYTPWRNFLALKRRLTRTEQRLILTQGDLRKIAMQINAVKRSR